MAYGPTDGLSLWGSEQALPLTGTGTAIIMVHNCMSSSYSQRSVDCTGLRSCLVLALYLSSASISSAFMLLYIFKKLSVTFFTLPFNELSLVQLTWL